MHPLHHCAASRARDVTSAEATQSIQESLRVCGARSDCGSVISIRMLQQRLGICRAWSFPPAPHSAEPGSGGRTCRLWVARQSTHMPQPPIAAHTHNRLVAVGPYGCARTLWSRSACVGVCCDCWLLCACELPWRCHRPVRLCPCNKHARKRF